MKNIFSFLLFFLFTLSTSFAQSDFKPSVSGIVKDKNGEILIGATVVLKSSQVDETNTNLTKGTVTNTQGKFSFASIPSQNYTLTISYIGYETYQSSFRVWADTTLAVKLPDGKTLSEIVIQSYREYPVTLTELNKEAIEKRNLGQDLPILLQYTPSVVSTSDAGAGVGYTGMRVRGSDATRTNVTINGIPLNDAESQGVFWVNMPDFASSASSVQIQRGVGTSVNGAGAFGATVNISTNEPSDEAGAEIGNSFGSFNTFRHNVQFNTGLLKDRIKFSGRLSKITSDGFIDKAFSDLKSFFVSGVYQNEKGTNIKLNIFGGREQTFQAWNGVPQEILEEGNRTYNELAGYDNEIDNYGQDHYQLIFDQKINDNFTANIALHYTKGKGYFEQFKSDEDFSDYGLEEIVINDSTIINTTDLIRRRWLDNDFYGTVFNINYESDATKGNEPVLTAIVGGGYNIYEGAHFGEIIWAEYASQSSIRDRYYENDATKTDFNLFGKVNYQVIENLFAFADLQIRTINYDFLGFDNNLSNVKQSANLSFFNPKFGLTYKLDNHRFYGSWARANREPNRDDFTESTPSTRPKAERLDNIELGWNGRFDKLSLSANYYLMNYTDQLILTGQVNDVGSYTRQNVDKSYRTGVEVVADYQFSKKFSWSANATFNQNKISDFTEYLDDYDNGGQLEINYGETDIAFSPSVIAANTFSFRPADGFSINLLSKYVGEQFLDNTSTDTRKLDAYFVNDLQLVYNFSYKFFKNIELNLLVNNILSEEYESNGYTFGYIYGGETIRQNYFYPQAGRNFLVGLKLKF
ncbi:TonB-dependent receptor [Bernardetia sp.]|uniref:TonB-dependent receptor n=1 Tax=Bernardetia sp. TaxID=1937974 RepID=UPI0025BD129E|nr:TonB-dependent receptor [Bernardetia sp.]